MIEGNQKRVFLLLLVITAVFGISLSIKPLIVGYTLLDVEGGRSIADDKKPGLGELTQLDAYVGEEFRYMVRAVDEDYGELVFSDDSELFDISKEGIIKFTPSAEMVGDHYVTIIVKDKFGRGEVRIVPLIIRYR